MASSNSTSVVITQQSVTIALGGADILSTFITGGVNAFAHLFLENISLGTGLCYRLHCVEYNFGTRMSADLGKISKKIYDFGLFYQKQTIDGGEPPPQHHFFTKRGAQMHYIRKSCPRAFQNTQKY